MQRVVASVLLLPFFALILMAAYGAVTLERGSFFQTLSDARYVALWYVIVCYAVIGFLALPMILVALRKGWVRWWHCLVAGAVVGAIIFALPAIPSLFDHKLHLHFRIQQLSLLLPGALIGMAHAALFWLLALWRNPAVVNPRSTFANAA